jgi:nucleoside-diphosphate-sugar epimerase
MRDWVHVEDVAETIPRLARAATTEVPIVNVATGIATSVSAIADMVIRAWRARTGAGAAVRFSGERRPGDPAYLVADCGRLREISGICSRLVESGVSEYVNWFISANMETP